MIPNRSVAAEAQLRRQARSPIQQGEGVCVVDVQWGAVQVELGGASWHLLLVVADLLAHRAVDLHARQRRRQRRKILAHVLKFVQPPGTKKKSHQGFSRRRLVVAALSRLLVRLYG